MSEFGDLANLTNVDAGRKGPIRFFLLHRGRIASTIYRRKPADLLPSFPGDCTMQRGNLSRRGFLTRSVGALTAAGLPLWYAQENIALAQQAASGARPVGANDRLHMGAIGTGTNRTRRTGNAALHGERGHQIMRDAMGQTGVQMIAVADCDLPNALFAALHVRNAPQGGSRDCQIYEDYRRLLENRNIDA